MASICFAFWVLTIVEISCPGLLLNGLFSQHLPEVIGTANRALLQLIVFIFAFCQIFIALAPPGFGWVYLRDHPLSEENEKEIQAAQKAKNERAEMQTKLMEKACPAK
jgi:hypothetical protein